MGDSCWDCDWESFGLPAKVFTTTSHVPSPYQQAAPVVSPTDQPVSSHTAGCGMEDICCDAADCSMNCSSVCDGFVNCDKSTVCSESHCDDENCMSTGSACFDKSCFADDHLIAQTLEAFLSQGAGVDWENPDFSTDPSLHHSMNPTPDLTNEDSHQDDAFDFASPAIDPTFPSFQSTQHMTRQPHYFHHHHSDQAFAQRVDDALWTPSHSATEDFDMTSFHLLDQQQPPSPPPPPPRSSATDPNSPKFAVDKLPCFAKNGLESCSAAGYLHYGCYVRNTGDKNLQQLEQPEHSHHQHRAERCTKHPARTQAPRTKVKRSTSSASSQILPTPSNTPSPLVGKHMSHLTTPSTVAEEEASYICQWTLTRQGKRALCGLIFSGPDELQEHLSSVHMTPLEGAKGWGYYCRWLGCNRPDEPFSQKSKLQGHFLTHSNLKSFDCSVCGKLFARQATLERHERSHRGEKPYRCKECGKAFTDSSELKTHSRTHTGEKPFKCNYPGCNFQTGDSSNLSSHKLTHGERKHRCNFPGCTKSFTRPDQLKRHQKTTHKNDLSHAGQAVF